MCSRKLTEMERWKLQNKHQVCCNCWQKTTSTYCLNELQLWELGFGSRNLHQFLPHQSLSKYNEKKRKQGWFPDRLIEVKGQWKFNCVCSSARSRPLLAERWTSRALVPERSADGKHHFHCVSQAYACCICPVCVRAHRKAHKSDRRGRRRITRVFVC